MKVIYLSLILLVLVIIGCDNSTAPTDCANVVNGTAVVDECGICGGDGSSCATYTFTSILSYTTEDCTGTGISGYYLTDQGPNTSLSEEECIPPNGLTYHDIYELTLTGGHKTLILNGDQTAIYTDGTTAVSGTWVENNNVITITHSGGDIEFHRESQSSLKLNVFNMDPNSPCSELFFTAS